MILSCAGLVLLAPAILTLVLLVRLTLGSPVLFHQTCPGLGGRPFRIVKFHSMCEVFDAQGVPLPSVVDRFSASTSVMRKGTNCNSSRGRAP
ncbi:sugar transferase [Halomonas sp. LBP4]|uniref:sugar transferase n=1 Tax=Halomonas sp. LBP4 TaxID=2044917 RepID=UPI000D766362|nr:hypothetical protein CR157_12330 [Halomonas sp. LBP4]